eukprot:5120694-Prymnesium_polylepis.5
MDISGRWRPVVNEADNKFALVAPQRMHHRAFFLFGFEHIADMLGRLLLLEFTLGHFLHRHGHFLDKLVTA